MDIVSALLLMLSATLASARNVLVKGFAGFEIKSREFFGGQASIFGAGCIVLLFVNLFDFNGISAFTVLFALVYGALLICAQWCYTLALMHGKTAICVTVYSFGFVIPTLSGAIFWGESLSIFAIFGILTVFPVLIISGTKKKEEKSTSGSYILYITLALLASGGLGIVQKIQQKSQYASQTSTFILTAFVFAFAVSFLFFLFMKRGEKPITYKNLGFCGIVGVFFSVCNLLNTFLAGALDSAIFFPAINIGSIVMSTVFGLIFYKEKLTKKDFIILGLGALAILLVNL